MASFRSYGSSVPFTLPVGDDGSTRVEEVVLSARFNLNVGSVYVEQEIFSSEGVLQETVLQMKCPSDDNSFWILKSGSYRVFGFSNSQMEGSTVVLTPVSNGSTVQLTPPVRVKIEPGEEHVTLLSDSDDDIIPTVDLSSSTLFPFRRTLPSRASSSEGTSTLRRTTCTSSAHPLLSPSIKTTPPSIPILDVLKKTFTRFRSKSVLGDIDFNSIKIIHAKHVPQNYNGDLICILPPASTRRSSPFAGNMDGMDKQYDGHQWCKTHTSNIQNDYGLNFRRSNCVGHLQCSNEDCDYLLRNPGIRNCTEWVGSSTRAFTVNGPTPQGSTIQCKLCSTPPVCLSECNAIAYYVAGSRYIDMDRAFIHLGTHDHPVGDGVDRESMDLVYQCVASQVSKTPKATISSIQMEASKDFLSDFLFKSPEPGEKNPSLTSVMDSFAPLASPNCRNLVAGSRKVFKPNLGPIDSIMALKSNNNFKFVHDNRFPGQSKGKVFIFKMSVDLPGSGVDLVRRMQAGGDMENSWIMFDHVKRVKDWTTMACHVYDIKYCKVLTIACCDMQSEDYVAQTLFWENLNSVMAENGIQKVNFKGFMADSAGANWIAVRQVYGSGDPKEPMPDRERTCLFHWAANLDKYATKYIIPSLQYQFKQLCRDYKDSKTQEDADAKYHAIRGWWATSGATTEEGMEHLSEWLGFWHYRYRQWGGHMLLVSD